jgi:hypothetical protein
VERKVVINTINNEPHGSFFVDHGDGSGDTILINKQEKNHPCGINAELVTEFRGQTP